MAATKTPRKDNGRQTEAPADEVRQAFGDFLDRAGFRGERVVVTRHGKRVAALVSIADLEKIDAA